MAEGPGKYDDLCTYVRRKSSAAAAIVIIVDGNKGNGFSVNALSYVILDIPELLEVVAKSIREDMESKHG